jgi:hypothetical protein
MLFFEMSGNRLLIHHALNLGNRFVAIASIDFDLVPAGTGKLKTSHFLFLRTGRARQTR